MPLRFGHAGDSHLDEDRYFADTAQCLEWFVTDAIRASVDLFVINGDLTTYKATIKERNLWVDLLVEMANGYLFPVRRPKTTHREVKHRTSLKKAHERVIKENFPDDRFTIYTFRHTYGTRHSQAGTELPVLAELMGHSNIQTTMIYVHAARKQKIEATAKLQAFVEAARRAKQLQEEAEAESWKPKEDEWGMPIVEVEEQSPQNPPQGKEIENLPF